MNASLDGKHLQPGDVGIEAERVYRLPDALVMASGNHLRKSLGIRAEDAIADPLPRCVTRQNPSLDNYLAELILRTCHAPSHYVPPFEECRLRGSTQELSVELNPALRGAVLIGIGAASANPDFVRVYDEHRAEGRRITRSTTQVVCEEHMGRFADQPGFRPLGAIVEEVSRIDAYGGATHDHLYSILKILHQARFYYPPSTLDRLENQTKRSVINAALAAVCTTSFAAYDNDAALAAQARELDAYVRHALASRGERGVLWNGDAAARVRARLIKAAEAQVHGTDSLLTLRKVHYALDRVWPPPVTAFVLAFCFESLLQAQASFDELQRRPLPFERVAHGNWMLYYEPQPSDVLPHRAIMARMGRERKRGILIVYDPTWRSTMIMRSRELTSETWRRFAELLQRADRPNLWYTPTQEDGTIANFLLNRSESFIGTPASELGLERLVDLFVQASKQ